MNDFNDEFGYFLESFALTPGKLLIVGDFNIHVDDTSSQACTSFLSLIDSFDLVQHVEQSTHVGGHILDLILSRASDKLLEYCFVSDLITDHFAVNWCARAHRPLRPVKQLCFRKLKDILPESFCADLEKLPLMDAAEKDMNCLLQQYNSGLLEVLDRHAPLLKRSFVVRPPNPWDNDDIRSARKKARRSERRSRRTGLMIDREIMIHDMRVLHAWIKKTKSDFLDSQIRDSSGKNTLFQLLDSILLVKPGLSLPFHETLSDLAEKFSSFFTSKINAIRTSLDVFASEWIPDPSTFNGISFRSFHPVTISEISCLISACPSKSSPLDPKPTFLLKKCVSTLAPTLMHIVNMSLATGVFPGEMKLALITPLLKKTGLDLAQLSNYRPVSLFSFVSKLLERVVAKQLVSHLESQSLFVDVQSAYRAGHLTETALQKV